MPLGLNRISVQVARGDTPLTTALANGPCGTTQVVSELNACEPHRVARLCSHLAQVAWVIHPDHAIAADNTERLPLR